MKRALAREGFPAFVERCGRAQVAGIIMGNVQILFLFEKRGDVVARRAERLRAFNAKRAAEEMEARALPHRTIKRKLILEVHVEATALQGEVAV